MKLFEDNYRSSEAGGCGSFGLINGSESTANLDLGTKTAGLSWPSRNFYSSVGLLGRLQVGLCVYKLLFFFGSSVFCSKTRFLMALAEFSEEQFNRKAHDLVEMSDKLSDNWRLNEKSGKLYLSKRQIVALKAPRPPAIDTDDPSVATNNHYEDLVSIEYHVLFHPSYQVPVLYFNARSGKNENRDI